MINNTTKRYKSVFKKEFENLKVKEIDLYQFGCEFEFYIDTNRYDLQNAIEEIRNKIVNFTNVDILVDLVSLPTDTDKNYCLQIKPDQSLDDNGIEISIPITTQQGVRHYIKNILPLIEKYGYTNEDTGLHFHISTMKQDGINFNFYLYMLMCHDKNLLSSWQPRSGYSQNVMDILSKNTKAKSRIIKNKKGTIWNLEKIDSNHIEIKAICGVNYHKEINKIIDEFNMYVKYFDDVLKGTDIDYRQRLINEHKRLIKSIDHNTKEEFSQAVNEAGLIN
jgi:transcription elongation factor Elf1